MHRFATTLRWAVILVVAIGSGMLARLIPSPYEESRPETAHRIQQVAAPDATAQTIKHAKPYYNGVDVDVARLNYASNLN
jgi:hypothetical protein